MPLMSIPAHYDGERVQLDEKVSLATNARLIVTVLEESDTERRDFLQLAAASLGAVYDDEEVEYTTADLKR
jgi:hypothetical protein